MQKKVLNILPLQQPKIVTTSDFDAVLVSATHLEPPKLAAATCDASKLS